MALEQKRPYALTSYNSETDPTPANEIVMMIDHSTWPEPKKIPYDPDAIQPDFSDATKADILAILEVPDVVSSTELAQEVAAAVDALVSEEEVERLSTIEQTVYPISLPASNSVAGRLAGYTPPAGWTVTQGASPLDLLVTHGLNRRVANATVWAVDGTEELKLEGAAGCTGVKSPDANSVLIMGLTNTPVALKIYLFFA